MFHNKSSKESTMRVLQWRRTRLSAAYYWRLGKLLLLFLLLLIFLVVPIRNTVCIFLPGLWREHSSLFLLKVALDGQSFPVDESPPGQSPIKLVVDESEIKHKFQHKTPPFTEFFQRISLLKEKASHNTKYEQELNTLLKFKPLMSREERAIAFFTLDVFLKACKAANLTYFLIAGSGIGAIRHHGMIPWDDDFDIAMNGSEWRKVRDVFSNIPGFELFTPAKVQWKFFMSSLPKGNRPFKWPNIDIFFFNENDDHIWAQTWGAKVSICNKKSDIFPLADRKFEIWSVKVPKNSLTLLNSEFGDYNGMCSTPEYIHKVNVEIDSGDRDLVKCKLLYDVYPFVFHRPIRNSNSVLEVKMVAGKSISNLTFPMGRH